MPLTGPWYGVLPWKKGSNTDSRSSRAMPGPSSTTSRRASEPFERAITRMRPPAGENFTAFDTRLSTTAASLS